MVYKKYFILRITLILMCFFFLESNFLIKTHFTLLSFWFVLINTFVFYCFLQIFRYSRALFLWIILPLFYISVVLLGASRKFLIQTSFVWLNFISSNKTEILNYATTTNLVFLLIMLVFSFLVFLPELKSKKYFQRFSWNKKGIFSLVLFCLSLVAYYPKNLLQMLEDPTFRFRTTVPETFVISTYKALRGREGGAQVRQGDQFNIKTRKPQPTILLHIGETVRGDHLFINGYEKKTTPYLATLPIANFGIIQSCFNQTVLSIPCLFQGLQKEGPYIEDTRQLLVTYLKQFHHQNNFNKVVEIFHQIGFKEVYIGPPIGRSVDYLFSQPYLERIVSKAVIKKLSDPRAMINQALSYLNKNKNSTKPLLVITRNKGSHSPFSIRYPKDFHPQGEPQNPTLFDMYDKTIMYLDYTINKEIAALKKLKKPSIFIYTSDHGESLNEVGLYDHVNLTKENFMVPFFIWVSDEYKKAYPKKYRALLKNVKIGYNKISQDYWINSILDGVGIVNKDSKNPVLNSQKSVFSADMKPEFPDFKWSYVHYPRN